MTVTMLAHLQSLTIRRGLSAMNYLSVIKSIIRKAKYRQKNYPNWWKESYGENHHIIPNCIMKLKNREKIGNESWNKVYLTAREHFIIHGLYYFHCRKYYGDDNNTTYNMLRAWEAFEFDKDERKITSRLFETLRILSSTRRKNSYWVYNESTKEKKFISGGEQIPLGFTKGTGPLGTWYKNEITKKCRRIKEDEIIPEGFFPGKFMGKMKERSKKHSESATKTLLNYLKMNGVFNKNKIAIHHKDTKETIFINSEDEIPENFILGTGLNMKRFLFIFDNEREEIVEGINKYCRAHNYNVSAIHKVRQGKASHHKDIIKVIKLN